MQPKGSVFHQELARYYLRFAEHEADEYNWSNAQYFAKKGLFAAYGKDVDPELPEDWNILPEKVPELNETRAALKQVLDFDTLAMTPELAARAVFSYDCWVEEEEKQPTGSEQEHLVACRENFYQALNDIKLSKEEQRLKSEQDAALQQAPVVSPSLKRDITTTTYVVFFDKGAAKVSLDGVKTLRKIASELETQLGYIVVVKGHTDAVGSKKNNIALAQKRAEKVKEMLLEMGVKPETLTVNALGEAEMAVATPKAEAKNRRVEIFVTY